MPGRVCFFYYLTDSKTFSPKKTIFAGKLNFGDSCPFFLEERLLETSFHIGPEIVTVFALIERRKEKKLDCKSPKILNKSPFSRTRTVKQERKKKEEEGG